MPIEGTVQNMAGTLTGTADGNSAISGGLSGKARLGGVLSSDNSQLEGVLSQASKTLSGVLDDPQESHLEGSLSTFEIKYEPYVLPPATTGTLGGVIVGDNLLVTQEGVLSVDIAEDAEEDNTRPITAAAVYTEIGNINALLATI